MHSVSAKSRVHGFCFNSNKEMQNVHAKLELALGHNQYGILTSLVYLENMCCVRFSSILILLRLLTVAPNVTTCLVNKHKTD